MRPPEDSQLHKKHVVSPDGYGVVDFVEQDNGWHIARKSEDVAKYGRRISLAALFEFQCPHRGHPKGFVPRQYLPQVWAGLDISPITNIGVFCDMAVRNCPNTKVEEWRAYHTRYHFNYNWGREIAGGVSAVFRREASEKMIDYGDSLASEFDKMMSEAVDGKECRIVHSQLYATDFIKLECGQGFFMTGFFYWMVFRYDVHIVKRNPGFLEKCTPLIYKCLAHAIPRELCTQPLHV